MIAVLDYGMGNLRSVQKALESLGADARLVSDPDRLAAADAAVLPGVGAISDAMAELRRTGLDQAIRAYLATGRPFLGICLGMQMLFGESEERGPGEPAPSGLGILPGRVRRLPGGPGLKVPHMGWNRLEDVRGPLFGAPEGGAGEGPSVYFVHSYYVECADRSLVTARATHGIAFDAAVERDNLAGVQFHPEKSGAEGLAILRRWLAAGGRA